MVHETEWARDYIYSWSERIVKRNEKVIKLILEPLYFYKKILTSCQSTARWCPRTEGTCEPGITLYFIKVFKMTTALENKPSPSPFAFSTTLSKLKQYLQSKGKHWRYSIPQLPCWRHTLRFNSAADGVISWISKVSKLVACTKICLMWISV